MSGVQGHVLGHVFRRGVEVAQFHFKGEQFDNTKYVQQLRDDAQLYEQAGPEGAVDPMELLPLLITAIIAMFIMASVRYTIGEVVSTLTMIESPSTTAIIEDKPPAYADEPDAPLEKGEPLIPSEAAADVEVMLIPNKPVTAKISATVKHLTRASGFTARWRGLGFSMLYHFAHASLVRVLASLFGYNFFFQALIYVFVSVWLSGLHMIWTHSMIVAPSSKPWYRRMVPFKMSKAILLPSLAVAIAQQATIAFPLLIAGDMELVPATFVTAVNSQDYFALTMIALHVSLVPLSALLVAFALLLPAVVTLTRIEAALLPETETTIVPFDRDLVLGDIDLSTRGGCRQLFVQAWLTFDRAARLRIIKLYAKLVFCQIAIFATALHVMLVELYVVGPERLAVLIRSGAAQLKLMAIEAQENAN